jgi:hypothetical protein
MPEGLVIFSDHLFLRKHLTNNLFGIDFNFDHGVKGWAEQWSVLTGLEYRF